MLEIRPEMNRRKKELKMLILALFVLELFTYAISEFFVLDIFWFYLVAISILFVVISVLIIEMIPQKILVDTKEGRIKNCIGNLCFTEFRINRATKIEYRIKRNGKKYVMIYGPGIAFEICNCIYSDRDVESVFEVLAPLSEKYGFEVKGPVKGMSSDVKNVSEYGNGEKREALPDEKEPYRVK